ncbi:MAG: DUF92 domain-containing protein [Saprospiraceae bacterium]|nr:DUF92 domain-containing protein [Saprospiraceae bacterium]
MINSDEGILAILGSAVFLLAVATEMLSRRGILPQWFCRKLLHISAVGACAIAPLWLQDLTVLRWMVALVLPLLLYLVATGRLFSEANGRRSWGIVWFTVAYLLLLIFAKDRVFIIVPMAILALSDAAAAIVGQLFARRFFQLTGDRKSLIGSFAFLVTTVIVIWASQYIFPERWIFMDGLPNMLKANLADHWVWAKVGFVVLLLTAIEALGSNGFDNLLIPLAAALLLPRSLHESTNMDIAELWIGVGVALVFVWFTVRRKALSWDGAIAAAVMGLWVLFFAGKYLLLPLIFFFVSSTLIGKLTKRQAIVSDTKHGKARDYRQVLCNGGIYAVLSTFVSMPSEMAMIVSLAVSTADTWASEIGIYFRGRTYDIWRWRPTPVGLSGGISWAGTLGGLAGAAATTIVSFASFGFEMTIVAVLAFTAVGFLGMLLDSVLGATLQARYRNEETGAFTDIPTNILHSGYPWMSNDAVNLLSNILTVVASFLLIWYFLFK